MEQWFGKPAARTQEVACKEPYRIGKVRKGNE
jgi:hypothetical protein